MEGHYETQAGAPLYLFGWPDNAAETVRGAVGIPKLGSLILAHDANATIKGLKEWPKTDWPNTPLVFWSFRVMVAIGLAMLGIGLWSLYVRWKWGRAGLAASPWLQRASVAMGPAGFGAVLAGWITTEAGRQPYAVYGLLRTADSVSPIATEAVTASLTAFVLLYFAVFGAGTFYVLRLMWTPPEEAMAGPEPDKPIRAAGITPGIPQSVPAMGEKGPRL